ncbi:MAG TPA: LytTR family DNA-binding domain-containing protein [Candidatus Synoicihabitans sp.]|nr:LytTR family DNA-binding domain-containing protein [Candidatus Synoicihabitans sp.]
MMSHPTALIADDEPLLRDALERQLAQAWPELKVVAQARNGREAIDKFASEQPNICFLDVHMPGITGVEVARHIGRRAHLVFVTAYDQYAVQAFTVRALDYVLKPFTKDRLLEAVARAREHVERHEVPAPAAIDDLLTAVPSPRSGLERILVKVNERYVVVATPDIEWIEAAANYVVLHTRGGNHVLRKTISALEQELPGHLFFRVSRSAIVNLTQVAEIQVVSAGEHSILLRHGARVPLTRGFRELQEKLQFLR